MTTQAKVICFGNHKGGVGKTCSTCNVGAGLARAGRRVLLIDLDPQANLSLSLGVTDPDTRNIYNVLTGELPMEQAVHGIVENLDLVPATLDLAGAEVELVSEAGREMILREAVGPMMEKYDYIIIDCAPSLGLLTTNALTCASEVYIPLQAQYLSLQGITKLTGIVDKIKNRLNKNLKIGGVFITLYDRRKVLNRDIADAIREHFGEKVFKTQIRDNVALAEAPSKQQDIFRYSVKSYGAEDYAALCCEILDQEQVEAN